MTTKEVLRRSLLKQRRSLQTCEMEQSSHSICNSLKTHPLLLNASSVICYSPFDNECNIWPILEHCLSLRKAVYLPKYLNGHYTCIQIDRNTAYSSGNYGIKEPRNNSPALSETDKQSPNTCWLVPGIAFSNENHRLGYGKGIYDRLLEDAEGPKLGIAYPFQTKHNFPTESTDIPMDCIISK